MPEVADIFRLCGARYIEQHGENMLPSHRRALSDLQNCRTPALGGQLYVCDHCGREHYVYHSCRNRACPKCHGRDTEVWLDARRQELLPVPYFHVGFTVPRALRELVRRHQKIVYPILMKAAAMALMKLAADPHYVGGRIGVMAVLHTWGRTLTYHPHVHCLVPAGGLDPHGQWRPARGDYLVPVEALSLLFRGIFLDLLRTALPDVAIPSAVRKHAWVVYCKPAVQGPEKVLTYLGRYVHRVAITNGRILRIDDGKVTFGYQNARDCQWRTMTLTADEFIRRFLQHVLPKGLHKVRYYGLWAPSNKAKRLDLRQRLTAQHADQALPAAEQVAAPAEAVPAGQAVPPGQVVAPAQPVAPADQTPAPGSPGADPQPRRCPYCQKGSLVFLRRVPAQQRSPP